MCRNARHAYTENTSKPALRDRTPERQRESHTYPVNIVWLSEVAINPVENV